MKRKWMPGHGDRDLKIKISLYMSRISEMQENISRLLLELDRRRIDSFAIMQEDWEVRECP